MEVATVTMEQTIMNLRIIMARRWKRDGGIASITVTVRAGKGWIDRIPGKHISATERTLRSDSEYCTGNTVIHILYSRDC